MRLCRAFLQYALHMTANDTLGSPYSSPDPNEHGDNPYVGDPGYSQVPQQAYTAQYATPQPNYTQQYPHRCSLVHAPVDQWNGMCIAGFICSFFFPLVGLVLSIIALVQINKTGEKSRGMAIAGIVIGGISTALALIAIIMVICGLAIGLARSPKQDGTITSTTTIHTVTTRSSTRWVQITLRIYALWTSS